jgi:hypothetical protein
MALEVQLDIVGTKPILMHSATLSDPLDENARSLSKISSKRKKTEDDYREMAKYEFLGGLYHDEDLGPYLPGDNLFRMLVDGARKRRLGVKVTSGVFVSSDVNPLVYKGPRSVKELMSDPAFQHRASCKVGTARVMRTRPQFKEWATSALIVLDTEVLDIDDFSQIAQLAGSYVGLGDWRPRFGLFTTSVTVLREAT